MTETLRLARIPASDTATFRTEYLMKRKPVVLTGLFKNQPLEQLHGLQEARQSLNQDTLGITENYVESSLDFIKGFLAGRLGSPESPRKTTTVGEYLDLVARDSHTRWIGTEYPAPEHIVQEVDLRSFGIDKVVPGYGNAFRPEHSTAHSLMFIANPGNASDLHTDWDGRDVFLYQVFGRKRVTLFAPASAPLLLPINQFGTVRLKGMPEQARDEFVKFANGWDDVLEPGEAVFMPAFYWHHLEYMDLALSFNFRFGGLTHPDALFLLEHAHRDMYLQNLLARSLEEIRKEQTLKALGELRKAVSAPYKSAREKYKAVCRVAQQAHKELGLTVPEGDRYTWIDCNVILDGLFCSRYISPGDDLTGIRRWYWLQKEKVRFLLRTLGYRLASWA